MQSRMNERRKIRNNRFACKIVIVVGGVFVYKYDWTGFVYEAQRGTRPIPVGFVAPFRYCSQKLSIHIYINNVIMFNISIIIFLIQDIFQYIRLFLFMIIIIDIFYWTYKANLVVYMYRYKSK